MPFRITDIFKSASGAAARLFTRSVHLGFKRIKVKHIIPLKPGNLQQVISIKGVMWRFWLFREGKEV